MRFVINIDDELGGKIEEAAEKASLKKAEWVKMACEEYLFRPQIKKAAKTSGEDTSLKEQEKVIEGLKEEILTLKDDIETQKDLKNTYCKLISEKDQRIEDLKESISRIEAMSITTTDQIASSKDERIKDLGQMIDHLQAQAAAHSAALQSAIKPAALESRTGVKDAAADDNTDMIQKPKWMFWK